MAKKLVTPTPENDDTWPIGMLPGGDALELLDEYGIPLEEPTEENE